MSGWRGGSHERSALVEAARRGDIEAFEEIVRRYQRGVCGFIHALVQDYHLAQDVAQETFLAVYRRVRTLQDSGSFTTWLFRIAHRQAVNAVRIRERRLRLTAEAARHRAHEASAPYDSSWQERGEAREMVRRALAALRGEWAAAVVLRYYEGLTCQEIAEVLGIEVENVRIRLYRGRLALRRRLTGRVLAQGVDRDELRGRRESP